MHIPKVNFEFSWIYNENWKNWVKLEPFFERGDYPSDDKILEYIKKIKNIWKEYEKEVLTEISKISRIKWKDLEIKCYVVGRAHPFSDPLTLPIYEKDLDWFIDLLVHEIIHKLFIQERNKSAWTYIHKKYAEENQNVRIHIPLHAIHNHIYLKIFGKERFEKELKIMSRHIDYKRSWEIVQQEGYQNILKEFTSRIK